MTSASIDIRDLCYTYPDGTSALQGISFSIKPGESVGLVGANGAGKSTFLLQLNGFLSPTKGKILIGGVEITNETPAAIRSNVGLVFQNPDDQLFMPTVGEDVAFGPLHAGWPAEKVASASADALERVGMSHLVNRPPYRLSAGEKRAVAIATVLAMSPEVLVMDEPSSDLDPRSRRRLIELLRSFHQTRIIATHDLELVVETCSRVIVIGLGSVVADGPTRDILNNEALMLAHGLERPHILRHIHPHY